jgi:SSS family solute:Na+ symporter
VRSSGFTGLDWAVIAVYLVIALGVGVWVGRKSRGSMENFFLSGRQLPWWLAGTSMVATSFASDTPLVISSWTRTGGVAGNWRWWAYIMSTLLVVVLFARLWRRSEVLTDIEFMELRYSGRPARFLRGFKSIYQVVFMHCFVMGWVILGMTKVLTVLFDLDTEPLFTLGPVAITPVWAAMLGCALLALIYSEVAGLWGVVLTDFIQFGVALAGSVTLMVLVVNSFGGTEGLVEALRANPLSADKLSMAPNTEGVELFDPVTWTAGFWQFAVFVGVIWFANKNADGSGVMVQRILASRNERHAWLATLWYAVAHNAVRPWPWILVALASILVLPPAQIASPVDGQVMSVSELAFVVSDGAGGSHSVAVPDTGVAHWEALPLVSVGDSVREGQVLASTDDEAAYPEMMLRFLPSGLLGLLAASFLAAFMSTIDTHVNLASSYLVNDLYRRFLRPNEAPAHYVRAGRFTGPPVLLLAVIFAATSDSVRGMFDIFTALFSGVGVVYLARWLWWRVNAWSEISALMTSGLVTFALESWPQWGAGLLPAQLVEGGEPVFAGKLLVVVGISTLVVLPVTLLTPAVEAGQLRKFYDLVRPVGFWGPLRGADEGSPWVIPRLVVAWLGATVFVLGCVLLPGELIFEGDAPAAAWAAVGLGGLALLLALPSIPSRDVAGRP